MRFSEHNGLIIEGIRADGIGFSFYIIIRT